MNDGVVVAILASGITLSVPILWAALGEVINEKAGVLNVGIEGVMLFGAFAGALVLRHTGSDIVAVLAAVPTGILAGCVLTWFYVVRGADQIVTGLMFNLLALGATTVMYDLWLTGAGTVKASSSLAIPFLSDLPFFGPLLFDQTALVYAVLAVALLVYWLMNRTWVGLYFKGVGERPLAASTAGLSVHKLRWVSLLFGCTLVAVGGASIIITQNGNFVPNVTAGQGFIALAVVVLGRFQAQWIVLAALLFGASTALQFHAQNVEFLSGLPTQLWLALPYLVTILAVVIAKRATYPAAIAIPFKRPGT